jgi:peptide/nickel transport system substrate-binding protein
VIDYAKSETNDNAAASLVAALEKAGIVATLNALEPGGHYGVVMDPEKQGSMSAAGWGPDWSNASTVLPELFAANGGFNLSQWDDEAFLAESDAAKVISDRAEQAKAWQALSKKSMELALALPTRFGKEQRIHGSKVSGAYIWGPYGSWPYAALSVN